MSEMLYMGHLDDSLVYSLVYSLNVRIVAGHQGDSLGYFFWVISSLSSSLSYFLIDRNGNAMWHTCDSLAFSLRVRYAR